MTFPVPPADNSGGYMISTYTNGTDTHHQRMHLRPFDNTATFTSPPAAGNPTVMAEWSAYLALLKLNALNSWTFTLTAIFKNNGDGTFTELFGWSPPAPVVGTVVGSTPNDQTRAMQDSFNFRDGFGGRARLILIAQDTSLESAAPSVVAGAPAGTSQQKLVDYLTNQSPVKSNIVSHGGHALQSPARLVTVVNRRLRRHYGYA